MKLTQIWLILSGLFFTLYSQSSPAFSHLLQLGLPVQIEKENNAFIILAGQAVLEIETGRQDISIDEVEIFTWKNPGGNLADSELMLNTILDSIRQSGWQITTSPKDPDYRWLARKNEYLIGYFAATSREADIYLGKTSRVPVCIQTSTDPRAQPISNSGKSDSLSGLAEHSPSVTSIIGNWGDLKTSQINYYDPSGMMVGSGLSRGYGFEFKADQSYIQSFLATSSRPDYKIFVYTTGTFSIKGDQLNLIPQDRHYRKWESNVLTTDEHSRPEEEQYIWTIQANVLTGKYCLYLIRVGETESREYCQQ